MKNKSLWRSFVSGAKYAAAALIIVYIVLLFCFAGISTKPFCDVRKGVEALLDHGGLVKSDDRGLKRDYGLDAADYDTAMYYHARNYLAVEEILLIEVKDKGQIHKIRRAAEKRLKERRDYFDAFAPDEAKLIDGAHLSVRGRYIFLAVGPKAEEYQAAFLKSL